MKIEKLPDGIVKIEGFDGYYVSKTGNVYSSKVCRGIHGVRILKPSTGKRLYPRVGLCRGGIVYHKWIHNIVAETFIPNPDRLPCVLHRNDNRLDNNVENLYWGTKSDNLFDAYRNGKRRPCRITRWGRPPLNLLEIADIRLMCLNRVRHETIARKYGICKGYVSQINTHK
jgi:hypothetical protein